MSIIENDSRCPDATTVPRWNTDRRRSPRLMVSTQYFDETNGIHPTFQRDRQHTPNIPTRQTAFTQHFNETANVVNDFCRSAREMTKHAHGLPSHLRSAR